MHTSPEVLAVLAWGGHAVDPADRAHLEVCELCRGELDSLTALIEHGHTPRDGETLDAPSDAVWSAIQAELGFIPVTQTWPAVPETASHGATTSLPADPVPAQPGDADPASLGPAPAATGPAGPAVVGSRGRTVVVALMLALGVLLLGLGIGLLLR